MITRDLDPRSAEDAAAMDRLINNNEGHNVRLRDDYIMVCDSLSKGPEPFLVGAIVARPVMYMHELVIHPNAVVQRRLIAESLVAHALSKGGMLGERYAHFTVSTENAKMHEFMLGLGAIRQPDGVLYELEIPKAHYKGALK